MGLGDRMGRPGKAALLQDAVIGGLVVHDGTTLYRSKILSAAVAPSDQSSVATGKRQHKPFVIFKQVDSASPILFQAAAGNGTFGSVTLFLTVRKAGNPPSYLVHHLTGVGVAHDTLTSAGKQKSAELEEVELTFQTITHQLRNKTPPDDWSGPL